MRSKGLLISCALGLLVFTPAKAAEDLSSFGEPVAQTEPVRVNRQSAKTPSSLWPADICAEIQRMEKLVISGARPTDRGMVRIGLLMLEQLHCGIDISKKIAADLAVLDDAQRKAQRNYQENMAAAQRAASHPPEPIIVQVPQIVPAPSLPDPPPAVHCFTSRLGGGMSTTTCR